MGDVKTVFPGFAAVFTLIVLVFFTVAVAVAYYYENDAALVLRVGDANPFLSTTPAEALPELFY